MGGEKREFFIISLPLKRLILNVRIKLTKGLFEKMKCPVGNVWEVWIWKKVDGPH